MTLRAGVSFNVTGDATHAQAYTLTAAFDIPNGYGYCRRWANDRAILASPITEARMVIFEQIGRFLDHGTSVLGQVSELLQESRAALAEARPALDTLPSLVNETRALVVATRSTMSTLSPLLVDCARQTARLLEAEAARRALPPPERLP